MSFYSMLLVIALVLASASQTTAKNALSDWMPALVTNYGGPSDGMNPNTASYGLSNVRPMLSSCDSRQQLHILAVHIAGLPA